MAARKNPSNKRTGTKNKTAAKRTASNNSTRQQNGLLLNKQQTAQLLKGYHWMQSIKPTLQLAAKQHGLSLEQTTTTRTPTRARTGTKQSASQQTKTAAAA